MDRLWWNHITKARKFWEDIVKTALGGKSILLALPENLPWKNTFLELIEDQLKLGNPKNAFETIRCPKEDAGWFLLNRYCTKERAATYRYGMTYAAFLGKCEDTVLNDRYIWVLDIPAEKYDEWLDFIVEYNKNVTGKTPAVFILEMHDDKFASSSRKGIKKIIFNQDIGAYDKFAFCALAATDNNCKEYIRPYFADLVSTVCGEDIELCAECVRKGNLFLENPVGAIEEIRSDKRRSNGEDYLFSKPEEEVQKLIWEVQLKNIFPIIEKYRSHFIKKYRQTIQDALPITNSNGEEIANPEEIEIGALVYMAGNGTLSISSQEYEQLSRFREARNKLAHLNILDMDMIHLMMKKANPL